MSAETGVTLEPPIGDGTPGTVVPYESVCPYSKLTVVEELLGLTVPLSVAENGVMFVAAVVTTSGGSLTMFNPIW